MKNSFVIDSNVYIKLFIREQDSPQAKDFFLVPTRERGNAYLQFSKKYLCCTVNKFGIGCLIGSFFFCISASLCIPTRERGNEERLIKNIMRKQKN